MKSVINLVFVILCYAEAQTTPDTCPEYQRWMNVGCENTCDSVPLKYCVNDTSAPECGPGCYCVGTGSQYDLWYRKADGSCVPHDACQNRNIQCCPSCGPTQHCVIKTDNCDKFACPYPTATCVAN
ncbi:hypothetical protein L596_013087 [Steinernema carpocapsae]|uniref:TIL domain-containing protein n=1 Tax=Steinernema carpocapsae TaxID=34508 RepID=A0A4V6A4Z7_STECR|nr:hypothetical protein L596_013087 [Steinernema carpocapsae]